MNDDRINRLAKLRDELAEITTPNYPNMFWSLINSWIAKATPIICRDWNEFLDDFQKIAVKPNKARIVYHNSDFSLSEQEHRRQWEIDNFETEEVRQNILGFLNGLLILPESPSSQKKKSLSKSRKAKSPVEVLVARYGLAAAILGILGTCITAYLGYISTRTQVELPIFATQTAESKMNVPTSTVAVSISATPTSHIWFTPYQNSFIEIISTDPDPSQTLNAAEDVPYSYKIRYFVPEFDWQGSGIEPHVQLERVVSDKAGLEIVVLNDIVAKIGIATTIDIEGRYIVPSDRDVWDLRIKIIFLTNDGGGTSGGNLVLPIQYSIIKSP